MLNLSVRTPLWTGNLDMKSDTLQMTGIMGSLRWWFEAILRGLDKYACDPTGSERCPVNDNKKDSYCPVCLIFGATGIRRMFRLFIDGGEKVFVGGPVNIRPGNRGWYLGSGLKDNLKIYITDLERGFDDSMILTPLIVASKWGGLGGKTQHGYGVIDIENAPEADVGKFKKAFERIIQEKPSKLNVVLRSGSASELPNLKEMFFAKIKFETDSEENWWKNMGVLKEFINDKKMIDWVKTNSVPIAPPIKYWLRYGSKLVISKGIENFLFGTMERTCARCYSKVKRDNKNFRCPNCRKSLKKEDMLERIASKINVSCAYKTSAKIWEFRIWGWIPKDELPKGFDREKFLNGLKSSIEGHGSHSFPWTTLLGPQTKNHQLKAWREFSSSRDTVKPEEKNVEGYLQSLLSGEGDKNDV